jgi:hypothetical protein
VDVSKLHQYQLAVAVNLQQKRLLAAAARRATTWSRTAAAAAAAAAAAGAAAAGARRFVDLSLLHQRQLAAKDNLQQPILWAATTSDDVIVSKQEHRVS